MFKLDLERAEEQSQIANIHWITEKGGEFQKNIYFCFTEYAKAFDWKVLKKWEYQATLSASCETCMQAKKQQLEQRTGSKLGKEYIMAIYCHPRHPCLFN